MDKQRTKRKFGINLDCLIYIFIALIVVFVASLGWENRSSTTMLAASFCSLLLLPGLEGIAKNGMRFNLKKMLLIYFKLVVVIGIIVLLNLDFGLMIGLMIFLMVAFWFLKEEFVRVIES